MGAQHLEESRKESKKNAFVNKHTRNRLCSVIGLGGIKINDTTMLAVTNVRRVGSLSYDASELLRSDPGEREGSLDERQESSGGEKLELHREECSLRKLRRFSRVLIPP
jgi:hypothetical protein